MQLEALPPDVIAQILRDAIKADLDQDEYDAVLEREEEERTDLQDWLGVDDDDADDDPDEGDDGDPDEDGGAVGKQDDAPDDEAEADAAEARPQRVMMMQRRDT